MWEGEEEREREGEGAFCCVSAVPAAVSSILGRGRGVGTNPHFLPKSGFSGEDKRVAFCKETKLWEPHCLGVLEGRGNGHDLQGAAGSPPEPSSATAMLRGHSPHVRGHKGTSKQAPRASTHIIPFVLGAPTAPLQLLPVPVEPCFGEL